MNKYFLILAVSIFTWSCGGSAGNTVTDGVDSTKTDTLVSDVNWGTPEEEEEAPKKHHSSNNSSEYTSSGGGGGAGDNDADVLKYQSYQRNGDSPEDFAQALIYPAIRMVYSDNFAKPNARVSNSNQDGNRYTMDVEITWKDHWNPKYMIKGKLEVNSDGSNAKFTITEKNKQAEVLEFTEDNFKSEITIPSL